LAANDGDAGLAPLREKFIRRSAQRLDDASHLIDLISADPDDRGALDEAMRKLHGLAGLGATFGFDDVTRIARQGEREMQLLLEAGKAPDAEAIAAFRACLQQLRVCFEHGGQEPAAIEVPKADGSQKPVDVVLLEDDATGHAIMRKVLERHGFSVRGAYSRAEAIALLDTHLPDVLVTDVLVPDGSGYDVVEHLRSIPGGDLPPVVVTSGLQGFLDRVEAIRRGADSFFEKPIDYAAMVRTVENLLERTKEEAPRVLFVTTDEESAELVSSTLTSAGCEVQIGAEIKRFDAELVTVRPDIVLLDAREPRAGDLARYVHQKQGLATIPVVLVGGEDSSKARIDCVRAGADDLLADPVSPRLLIATVAARIERSRLIRNLVERDGLTGLLTHSAFMGEMKRVWNERRQFPERQPSMILLDIDFFKQVNDTYGHPAGDRVLVALAATLRRNLRRSDIIARYGGEEFAIVLEDLATADAGRLVDRIREEFAAVEQREGERTFVVSFSAGAASVPDSTDPEAWPAAADQALYRAKREGRNRVVVA
jgi:diguanylate cyclase (GGDEF)-like protein